MHPLCSLLSGVGNEFEWLFLFAGLLILLFVAKFNLLFGVLVLKGW